MNLSNMKNYFHIQLKNVIRKNSTSLSTSIKLAVSLMQARSIIRPEFFLLVDLQTLLL